MREIILRDMGWFKIDKKLKKLLKDLGYSPNVFNDFPTEDEVIKTRMDERIIQFIKDNGERHKFTGKLLYFGNGKQYEGNASLSIVEVDVSRYWAIDDYDSQEFISFIKLKDETLKRCVTYGE